MPVNDEVWVVIPAYNEAGALREVLRDLGEHPYHVVVVDDGSRDDTAQAALRFPVTVLRHAANLGQGAAIQTGIRYALGQPGTGYIVTFDADGQHRPSDLPAILDILKSGSYDIVLGSRFMRSGRAVDIGRVRRLALRLAVWLTRFGTGLQLTDTHNGLRALTAEAASRLNIEQNGMAHASEILSQVAALKLRYCEAPVTVTYTAYSRLKGQSLFNGINILWDLFMGKLR